MPEQKISTTIKKQIADVRERLRRLEETRGEKREEDFEWFKRFYTDWIEELKGWLHLATMHEDNPQTLDEWLESVEADLKECLNKRTLH